MSRGHAFLRAWRTGITHWFPFAPSRVRRLPNSKMALKQGHASQHRRSGRSRARFGVKCATTGTFPHMLFVPCAESRYEANV